MPWTRRGVISACAAGVIAACVACDGSTSHGAYRPPASRSTTPATTAPSRSGPQSQAPTSTQPAPVTGTTAVPTRSGPPPSPSPSHSPVRTPSPKPDPARTRRIVAYYGAGSQTPALGVLGRSDPETAWARLQRQADRYATPAHPVQPAFELISSVANATPGPDGTYRTRQPAAVIDGYLRTVRRHHGLLILDIQPGRANFVSEAQALRKWLLQPDVGLALDPEWRMAPGQVPGRQIGSVSAVEVNAVSGWLDQLVADHHLPTKLFLLHKFRSTMVRGESELVDRPHLHEVVNMDGFGAQKEKRAEYRDFAATTNFDMGIKLFYKQDVGLMTPEQVLGLKPAPAVIDYQ